MKTLKLLLLLISGVLMSSCGKSPETIPGVYVLNFMNACSIASDTLIIKVYDLTRGTYEVQRRDGYHRIRKGQILPKEFRQEEWMATFDKDRYVLQESSFGKIVYVNTGHHTVFMGGLT